LQGPPTLGAGGEDGLEDEDEDEEDGTVVLSRAVWTGEVDAAFSIVLCLP